MPYTQVANLDFEDIKSSLKDYLRATSDFTDYDFEGSAMATLLDTLAYNTYYTAFNTNMVVNELFIDSATLRDNVVSIAKQLGYRPKSATAPVAYVSFTATYVNPTSDTELLLKKGTGFIANYDNTLYQYVVLDDAKGQVSNGVATFTDVPVYEGTQVVNTFTINTSFKNQRFILDNQNIDTNSIRVKVFSGGGSFSEPYLVADNILDVDGESKVFFLDEIDDERYEVILGDGVLGKKIENASRVEVSYITTNGPTSNGVRSFIFSGVLENTSGVSPQNINTNITSSIPSAGGENIESTNNIKFNAPKSYGAQDRAVTSNDYSSIVRKIYPSTSDIIIFGGEDQVPPEYGKVFIVLKPSDASYLTSLTKQNIETRESKPIRTVRHVKYLYSSRPSKTHSTIIGLEIRVKLKTKYNNPAF